MNSPKQRPVTQSFDVFSDLRLNKRFSKQSWGWWSDTSSRPLWRHCNGLCYIKLNQTSPSVWLWNISTAWQLLYKDNVSIPISEWNITIWFENVETKFRFKLLFKKAIICFLQLINDWIDEIKCMGWSNGDLILCNKQDFMAFRCNNICICGRAVGYIVNVNCP